MEPALLEAPEPERLPLDEAAADEPVAPPAPPALPDREDVLDPPEPADPLTWVPTETPTEATTPMIGETSVVFDRATWAADSCAWANARLALAEASWAAVAAVAEPALVAEVTWAWACTSYAEATSRALLRAVSSITASAEPFETF